jgi:uncharacterized protein with NRDE domain
MKAMCLILLGWRAHPDIPLLVAANRDEFYKRDAQPLHWWSEGGILAGRDVSVEGGGTWMGISRAGRFAAVTNVRIPDDEVDGARTRGELAVNYLDSQDDPRDFLTRLAAEGKRYNGFNLLVGTLGSGPGDELWWYSNRSGEPQPLEPGVHGVSNASLDTPWPKVVDGVAGLTAELARDTGRVEPYLDLLSNRTPAPDDQLPHTGLGLERERAASAAFINVPGYGTRASTVVRVRSDRTFVVTERSFDERGATGTVEIEGGFD